MFKCTKIAKNEHKYESIKQLAKNILDQKIGFCPNLIQFSKNNN